jgi:UDPglucose 6-dehydrogenase
MTHKTIAIMGAGYVGLATAATFLSFGHSVRVLDISHSRIDTLNNGQSPIYEPGLDEILDEARSAGRVSFTTDLGMGLPGVDVVFVCVGTPRSESGEADLSFLRSALATVSRLVPAAPVVIKSTVPPGSYSALSAEFPELVLVSNPEFLQQGSAVADALEPNRVVIGSNNAQAVALMKDLYAPIEAKGVQVIVTDTTSAELIKYGANTMLAIRVAFINEIADVCEATGADIDAVARGIGLDPRIGPAFLKAGPGFGGSCFPKDTQALVEASRQLDTPVTVVEAAETSNRLRRASLAKRVVRLVEKENGPVRVGVLGLTFKAGTDDLRESPAIDLIKGLRALGAAVRAFDPMQPESLDGYTSDVALVATAADVGGDADVVVIATEWPEFRVLDFEGLAKTMAGNTVVDLRNLLDPASVGAAGLTLHQVGKSNWRDPRPTP